MWNLSRRSYIIFHHDWLLRFTFRHSNPLKGRLTPLCEFKYTGADRAHGNLHSLCETNSSFLNEWGQTLIKKKVKCENRMGEDTRSISHSLTAPPLSVPSTRATNEFQQIIAFLFKCYNLHSLKKTMFRLNSIPLLNTPELRTGLFV